MSRVWNRFLFRLRRLFHSSLLDSGKRTINYYVTLFIYNVLGNGGFVIIIAMTVGDRDYGAGLYIYRYLFGMITSPEICILPDHVSLDTMCLFWFQGFWVFYLRQKRGRGKRKVML